MLPTGEMRWIKFGREGYESKRGLCNHCGLVRHCGYQEQGTLKCGAFVPVLKFRSFSGTQGSFNTFRHGRAWVERVKPGSMVALLNVLNGELRFAVVESVLCGEKHQMEREHGKFNHLMLGFDGGSDDDLVESFRLKRRRNSGNLIYNNNDYATVVYIKAK